MRRYLLVIKAETAENAIEIARNIPGFNLDESYKPILLKKGEFCVRGESIEKPAGPGIESYPDSQIHTFNEAANEQTKPQGKSIGQQIISKAAALLLLYPRESSMSEEIKVAQRVVAGITRTFKITVEGTLQVSGTSQTEGYIHSEAEASAAIDKELANQRTNSWQSLPQELEWSGAVEVNPGTRNTTVKYVSFQGTSSCYLVR